MLQENRQINTKNFFINFSIAQLIGMYATALKIQGLMSRRYSSMLDDVKIGHSLNRFSSPYWNTSSNRILSIQTFREASNQWPNTLIVMHKSTKFALYVGLLAIVTRRVNQ